MIFSALTVAVSLSALLIFPLYFLRSFAYAGIAVVAVACLGSIIVLPAMLAGLGRRVDSLSWRKARGAKADSEGFWHRTAITVMKRPWPFALGVTALLLALGTPFLSLKLGVPDDRVLPPSAFTRDASDQIRQNFSSQEAFAVQVVAAGSGKPDRAHRRHRRLRRGPVERVGRGPRRRGDRFLRQGRQGARAELPLGALRRTDRHVAVGRARGRTRVARRRAACARRPRRRRAVRRQRRWLVGRTRRLEGLPVPSAARRGSVSSRSSASSRSS